MTHTRTSFRDAALGPWSSHPAFLGRRSRTWALLGFLPLGAGIVLFLASWQFGAVTLVDLAMSWTTWFPLVLALVVFGFSASATALLVGRASTVGAFQLKGSGDGHIRLWTFLAAVGLVSGVAFALTRGAALQASLTPETIASFRLAGHLIGTVPVFLLLVGLEFGGSPIDEWGESPERLSLGQGLRRAVVLFSVFVGYLLPVIWVDRVAAALDLYKAHLRDPSVYSSDDVAAEFMRWVPGLTYDRSASGNGTPVLSVLEGAQDFIAALAILVPLCGLTGFVFLSAVAFVATAKSRKVPVGTEEIVRREGYDLRPTGESWDPNDGVVARPRVSKGERFRPDDSENSRDDLDGGQGDAPSDPPPWLADIQQASVGSQPLEWGEVRRAPPLEVSPSSGRSDLAHLFTTAFDPESGVGTPPTKDQVDALEHFDRQFTDFLVAEDREGQCVFPSTDLLVVGAPGSGRTTLLLAVALNSVVLRGQSVLLLAPTPEKAHLYVRRLRDLASRGGVGWHVAVGQIDEDAVRSWADPISVGPAAAAVRPPHRSPIGSLPDILVGTPHDYERCLFGADIHHAPVRRALLRLQVVLVEDVTSYSTAERRHLPFLLEKHRLVLASEHLPAQFLVVAPDLTKDAADYLKQRLFGEKAPAAVRRLRPPERPAPWLLDVAASDPTEAVEALAAAGAAADLRVVLWRPGVGKTDVAKLSSRLSGSGGRVQVVSDLDELTAEDGIETDLAVYRAHTARQQTLALSSHVSGAATVLVRVTRPGALIPLPESEKTLPVLPSVESEALFVSHLMSAVHYLSPFSPAPRDIFARIGLRPACQLTNLRTREVDYEVTPGLTLRLDPPEDKAEAVAAARRQTWSFVALHLDGYDERQGAPPPPRPVEMFRPLPRGLEIRGASGRDRVYLGEAEVDERSIASWVTQQNESLDRMDLACADDLMHRHGTNRFVPREIRDENGNLVVRGEPFRDKDLGESYLPVFEASIQLPQDVKVDPEQGGVAPRHLRWVSVRDPDLGAPQGQFWLAATYDVTGMVSRLAHPAPLHYGIRLGALLLGPERIIAGSILSERQERTRQAFVGCWTTRRDQHAGASGLRPRPWPVLSLAVTSGLRDVLPGLFDYCRLVAHRGPADGVNDDRAFVLCYEPSSTRGTVAEAMRKLLMDTELTLEVLTAARRMLADVDPHATEALVNLMVDAGLLMGDGWYDPEVGGEALLMEDTEGAIKLLDGALADVRATKERGARGRQQRQGVGEEGAG